MIVSNLQLFICYTFHLCILRIQLRCSELFFKITPSLYICNDKKINDRPTTIEKNYFTFLILCLMKFVGSIFPISNIAIAIHYKSCLLQIPPVHPASFKYQQIIQLCFYKFWHQCYNILWLFLLFAIHLIIQSLFLGMY